ncbi:MAG: hypothetical protein DLM70_01995 [Chloroflexi bacterium]|nr:MAG: hypothetical protein DLM70_01995 [Chloroflexota bacterium]
MTTSDTHSQETLSADPGPVISTPNAGARWKARLVTIVVATLAALIVGLVARVGFGLDVR